MFQRRVQLCIAQDHWGQVLHTRIRHWKNNFITSSLKQRSATKDHRYQLMTSLMIITIHQINLSMRLQKLKRKLAPSKHKLWNRKKKRKMRLLTWKKHILQKLKSTWWPNKEAKAEQLRDHTLKSMLLIICWNFSQLLKQLMYQLVSDHNQRSFTQELWSISRNKKGWNKHRLISIRNIRKLSEITSRPIHLCLRVLITTGDHAVIKLIQGHSNSILSKSIILKTTKLPMQMQLHVPTHLVNQEGIELHQSISSVTRFKTSTTTWERVFKSCITNAFNKSFSWKSITIRAVTSMIVTANGQWTSRGDNPQINTFIINEVKNFKFWFNKERL